MFASDPDPDKYIVMCNSRVHFVAEYLRDRGIMVLQGGRVRRPREKCLGLEGRLCAGTHRPAFGQAGSFCHHCHHGLPHSALRPSEEGQLYSDGYPEQVQLRLLSVTVSVLLSRQFFLLKQQKVPLRLSERGAAIIFEGKQKIKYHEEFLEICRLLMTAAAGGMLTSCQDKTEPEEDPVTITKVWAAKTEMMF